MKSHCLDNKDKFTILMGKSGFMVLKEITLNVPGKGKIDLKFYLHFDNHSSSVGEIKIHTDFDSSLPRRAFLKQEDGVWKLFDEHPVMENKEVKMLPVFLNDDLSKEIARRILAIQSQEMP